MKIKINEDKRRDPGFSFIYDETSQMYLCGKIGRHGDGGHWDHDKNKAKIFSCISHAQNAKDHQESEQKKLLADSTF